jgi:hypothetical protein
MKGKSFRKYRKLLFTFTLKLGRIKIYELQLTTNTSQEKAYNSQGDCFGFGRTDRHGDRDCEKIFG